MIAKKVLVLGIVLTDVANLADSIAQSLAVSQEWTVEQRWVAIGKSTLRSASLQVVESLPSKEPKFAILNRLLGSIDRGDYDYVIVTDDDIELPEFFLDQYLAWVGKYDFALAQPARTHDSYIDHRFVEQLDGITARQTRYVEIGPLFSMREDALPILTPFDVTTPMGWGYDFTWPLAIQAAQLRMGIVDAVPVRHKLRKPVANYVHSDANEQMKIYLGSRPHLTPEEAFHIVESYT
ncbi:MAG: hypothetical protein WBM04_09180 [Candidatus Korobacteraceae bacterium]